MKKYLILLCLSFIVLGCGTDKAPVAKVEAPNVKNISGWYKTHWGMTDNEILEAFKNQAVRLEKPQEQGKYVVNITIDRIDIADMMLSVRFLMDKQSAKLRRVQLTPIGEGRKGNNPGAIAQFDHFERILTKKYGTPVYKDAKKDGYGSTYGVMWHFPDTSIELFGSVHDVILMRFVSLSYSQNTKDDDNIL